MADEIKTEITLTGDKSIQVRDTVEKIDNAIRRATNPHIPLIKVTDRAGNEVWINAHQICALEAYRPSEPMVDYAG